MNPTYEEKVANINSVASTSAEDKARAISYLDKPIALDTLKANEQPVVTKPQTIETEPTIELSELDTETERLKAERQKQEKGITDIYKLIAGEEAKETEYIEEMGGFQDEALYKEKKNALMTEQKALRDRIEKARITFGGTTAGLNDEIRRLERESSNHQADLALEGNLAMGRYESALNIAQRKVQSAIKPLQADLESRMFIYNNNKDLFSKAESAKLEELFADKQRKIEREEKTLQSIENIKIEAAKNGMNSFAGWDNVKTIDEALNLAGKYITDKQIIKLDNGNTIMVDAMGRQIASFGGATSTGTRNYALNNDLVKETYNGDIIGAISNVINDSGAKQNEQTNSAINVIAGLQKFVRDNPSGEFPGLAPVRLTPARLKSPEAITNLSNIEAINLKVQQWASGAALTDEQTKQVSKITPRKGDNDKQVRVKVNALTNYMISQVQGQLAGQGINFSMDNVDLFTKSPEDELTELYSDPQMKSKIQQAVTMFPNYSPSEILQIVKQ